MEQFKLKSIDELDLEFISASRGQNAQSDTNEHKSLIPEISKNEPVSKADETIGSHYFQKPAQPLGEDPVYSPKTNEAPKKARPLVPIGQSPSPYVPVGTAATDEKESLDFSDDKYGEAHIDNQKRSSGKVAFAGKIISIILLASTVVVFILGCFVTIFLDNNGSNIGGVCFNTMSQDIEELGVPQNSLIISKIVENDEYAPGDLISVPSSTENRCDIQSINYVNVFSNDAQITTTAMADGIGYSSSVMASECYGIVNFYIPVLGGLLNFAMDNAILVCILFVLLAALWCLLLVWIEKVSKPSTIQENTKGKKK